MESYEKYAALVKYMEKLDRVLVAFSGGVDSSLLLAAALDALGGERVLAATASSSIRAPGDLEEAGRLAALLGARWRVLETAEMQMSEFVANSPERCYYCKRELLSRLAGVAAGEGAAAIVEGSGQSDTGDYRPGFRAVKEGGVLSPLMDLGMTKEEIRSAARERGIPSWNRPSEACLCSRIPYGQSITEERIRRIYLAEAVVKKFGAGTVRVRDHGEIARLEVLGEDMEKICGPENREHITEELRSLGYKFVALDLEGYKTGKMNYGV